MTIIPTSSSPSRNHTSGRGRGRSTVILLYAPFEFVSDAEQAQRRVPSMAEYLDALKACLKFGEYPGSPLWERIEEVRCARPLSRKQPLTASDPP